ncbi:PREDICTED: multisubstrate pseudouridine synthase 7 isoform X2 [Populus euphratica]|uniref:Multisubstrate pseudouridine synthase 7 isoform X2 n=1 Tax=Populus euphratica TaxID=75702 RepID=A0AAJ6UMF4_POPEU|nr:PREDICTED: multisubstrate pseudouridine synthase 7 isoform X2 [Populus euphratica]
METSKAMEESDVGILCYISQLPGFRGILKQRYADFIVNEVDTDGNVVHLTCLEPPPQMVEETKECEAKVSDEKMSERKSHEAEMELFRSLAGDSDAEKLESLISQVDSRTESEDSVPHIVLSPDSDKTHRTAVHNFFKQNFKFLVTDTTDGPDASSKCIRVRLDSGGHKNNGRNSKKRKERGEKPFDSRGSSNWPEHLGKFLRFHLYKENKDTQEALGIIGKMLGIQSKSFGFAGTKDKRAVSTQRVTVFKQQASRLAALNDRLIGIKVGDFCHVKEGLLLGKLLGNRFTVTLRGVIADSEDTIKAAADSLGRHGFINYFGLQRFGTGSVPTHLIGAALLRGEWKTAVSMILDPREGERDVIRKAREYYKESNDIEGTLRQLPRHLVAERAVLQCLKKCPGDYLQAMKAIPRTLRMMYVHGYQSYLWNHAASERLQKYGFDQVVLGDLVYCKGDDNEKETVGVNSESNDDNCDDTYDCSHLDETSGTDLLERKNTLVKVVTVEDMSTGNYTVDDVILPMPGSRVIFPTNEIATVYHDLAKKDAINLTESVHHVKEFSITSMTGSYRRVFQKPLDFEWLHTTKH